MADVTYTVLSKNGSYDGDMVVKQYTTVNIDSGDTVTTDQPCRGIFMLATGNLVVDGTLIMRGRGALADPTASGGSDSNSVQTGGLQFPFLTSGGSSSLTAADTLLNGCGTTARTVIANFKTLASDGTILSLIRQGTTGGAGQTATQVGISGANGSTGQTGGGGSGGANYSGTSGAGSYGSCFSGGSGGGATDNGGSVTAGTIWAGAGGNSATGHNACSTGAAGNPKGGDVTPCPATYTETAEGGGNGGLIILVVGGNVTIGASGSIISDGGRSRHVVGSGGSPNSYMSTGGGAGGGNIIIAHRGTYTNNGTVSANGGRSGRLYNDGVVGTESTADGTYSSEGGDGGNGSVQVLQIQ